MWFEGWSAYAIENEITGPDIGYTLRGIWRNSHNIARGYLDLDVETDTGPAAVRIAKAKRDGGSVQLSSITSKLYRSPGWSGGIMCSHMRELQR